MSNQSEAGQGTDRRAEQPETACAAPSASWLDGAAETLAKGATTCRTPEGFLAQLADFLHDSPLKVERVFLSLQTLHPAFRARTYLCWHGADHVSIREWPHGLQNQPGYYDSPDYQVHSSGKEYRVDNLPNISNHPCELYQKLKSKGYTDYLMVPLCFGDGTINTLSISTTHPSGFAKRHLDRFRELTDLLTIIFERYVAVETRNATLDAYLGRSAADRVLRGHIRAGHGETLEAAILFADLHDFTVHAARLDATNTVRLLNTYFDCLVGPIEEQGGYVLKFIGDAVLAFFPLLPDQSPPRPREAVLAIRDRLAALNRARKSAGRPPLRHALFMHVGRVLYGNVGSSQRLDFTIIGDAVNVTARGLEAIKPTNVEYAFTSDFAERFGNGLEVLDAVDPKGRPLLTLARAPPG